MWNQRGLSFMVRALLACVALWSMSCGNDDRRSFVGPWGPLVGGPCVDEYDCVSGGFCVRGGDYPDGTCTVRCNRHDDCPGGTACIDRNGGVCLLMCSNAIDCRGGYTCRERDDRDGRGESLVCIR